MTTSVPAPADHEDARAHQEAASRSAKVAAYRVHNILREHPDDATVPLVAPDGDEDLTVPREAAEMFMRILSSMAAGQPVTVIPMNAELTTQEAADLLNVSRPFVIKLVEQGEIDYRMVGTHRRLQAVSVRDYLRRMRRSQHAAIDELAELTHEMGLYE
jgi:excisionase family DNA binding protein